MYNNLRFFKGTEYDMNLVQNSNGVWIGAVYLPEVSTGLYESVNIFILEETIYNGDVNYNKPVADSNASYTFDFKWINPKSPNASIFMYDAVLEDGITKITVNESETKGLAPWTSVDSVSPTGMKVLNARDNTAIQINVALNSEKEGIHDRYLSIYANDGVTSTLIASIKFYGETVEEDERLRSLLENFGATLSEGDFLLFKEHDITEQAPDYILLNRKRKELLLELHNIKPFVGTYKAILNAIDFFGYNNLTLKEYWINVDNTGSSFGKMYAVPVPNSSKRGEMIRKKMSVQVPSSTMKKTSRFSLVYRLNEPNGGADQWDIPTVDEIFEFTPQEILIKLYGLKNKLQREYLPLNAKIVDIVAEGDYFTQKNLNVWNNQNPIAYFSEGHTIRFEYAPEGQPLFIEDLAHVFGTTLDQNNTTNNYNLFLTLDANGFRNLTSTQYLEYRDIIEEFYAGYQDRDLSTYNQDIPVGCPVILDGRNGFDRLWDQAAFTWNDAMDPQVTWNNWWKRWVYEIEWVVTGPRGYNETFRGPISDNNENDLFLRLPIILPYIGSYNVEMRVYDLFGHRSHYRVKDMFTIRNKEIELYGIYKWLEDFTWDQKVFDWNKSGGYWDNPQNNQTQVAEHIAPLYLTMDRANYSHDESQGVRFSTVRRYQDIYSDTGYSETTGPYRWGTSDFRWTDARHLWWDATRVGSDQAASFKIDWIEQSNVLTIEHFDRSINQLVTGTHVISSATPVSANDISGWQAVTDELNLSTNSIVSKFIYNIVVEDTNNDGTADTFRYIIAVGKEYSKTYDFELVYIDNATGMSAISGEQHVVHYNPTFDDTRVFSDFAEIEKSTHVTISVDNTKMPGLKNPTWKILNVSNPEINDIYYNNMWLTYLFPASGYYSIELSAEDTNGNKNVVRRNMIKVK
jgi:hypothetical protein